MVVSCDKRAPMDRKSFLKALGDIIREKFGISIRHDIKDETGRDQEGWRGLRLGLKKELAAPITSE